MGEAMSGPVSGSVSGSVSADRGGVAKSPAVIRRTRPTGPQSDGSAGGDYLLMSLELTAETGFAATARPGQFVALSVGGDLSGSLLRRSFSIYAVSAGDPASEVDLFTGRPTRGADRVDLVVSAAGAGTRWLTSAPAGTEVDLIGPLGRPFPLPQDPVPCVLVGGGYGAAPLFWLADALRVRGCRVDIVLGAASADRLFGVDLARSRASTVSVTTDDGSMGRQGWVSDVLPEVIEASRAAVVYACGPMGMLHSVSTIAARHGAVAQVAVEEAMACGVGVCMTCVMPVADRHGEVRMLRSCVDGPTFRGDRVVWDAFADGRCTVPTGTGGTVGAAGTARPGGH